MQGKSGNAVKKRAFLELRHPNQLTPRGFETHLPKSLRNQSMGQMAQAIPWYLAVTYNVNLFPSQEGRPPITGIIVLGQKSLNIISISQTVKRSHRFVRTFSCSKKSNSCIKKKLGRGFFYMTSTHHLNNKTLTYY